MSRAIPHVLENFFICRVPSTINCPNWSRCFRKIEIQLAGHFYEQLRLADLQRCFAVTICNFVEPTKLIVVFPDFQFRAVLYVKLLLTIFDNGFYVLQLVVDERCFSLSVKSLPGCRIDDD